MGLVNKIKNIISKRFFALRNSKDKSKENVSNKTENFLNFECSPLEEGRRNRDQLFEKILKNCDYKNLEDLINCNASFVSLDYFRNIAIKSYNKDEFKETIPKELRPLVDRSYSMEVGQEKEYHKNRTKYVNDLVNEINKNPIALKNIESFLLGFFINNIIVGQGDIKTKSNAILQFKVLETNINNIYSLLSLRNFGGDNYIIGVGENNDFYVRNTPKAKTNVERISYYGEAHSHAVTFMSLNPDILGKLIPDGVKWAKSGNRFNGLKMPGAGMLGFEMLRTGQENKYFHSSQPHEIIINDKSIKRMTVIDDPPDTIYYKTRFSDDSISVGAMIITENSGIGFNSDLISTCIMNPEFHTNECYVLYDIAGSIARDMFICERIDRFYQPTNQEVQKSSRSRRKKQNKIIWLPRFKINLRQEPASPEKLREYIIKLSPCHVSGHIRKCDNPHERQINLARSLGINLPIGYTYVREHERSGSEEFSRFYKSKSAMSLLYEMR